MGGIQGDELLNGGYTRAMRLVAVLPMTVWELDLEVARKRHVSAAELVALRLADGGIDGVAALAQAMGMAGDVRLAERTLVRLLGVGALAPEDARLAVTATGRRWIAEGLAMVRERVAFEVRHDPLLDTFDWVDDERRVIADDQVYTLDLPLLEDQALLTRKPAIAELVRARGLPDDVERSRQQARGDVELLALTIRGRRCHWREVQVDVWRHPERADERHVGYLSGAESPQLTGLLVKLTRDGRRKRFVPKT